VTLRHPDAVETVRHIDLPAEGTAIAISLWRRRPDILPLRPVYPGADLVDASFLSDGRLALTASMPARSSSADLTAARELWRLDPATGSLTRLVLTGAAEQGSPLLALAPDGRQVAYLVQGSAAVSATLWPAAPAVATGEATSRQAAVWLTAVDGRTPPRRIFELPRGVAASAADPEHLTDLVWTPDSSYLVAITRLDGTPARSHVFLIDATAAPDLADASSASELLLLPAEIVPASLSPDPSGRWLAFVARAATASNSGNALTLCVLELRAGGAFRDLADLGSDQRRPTTAPVAWATPRADRETSRLVFVKPVPGAATNGTGFFDLFGTLRPPEPTSGLFVVDLDASGIKAGQPRRFGTLTGVAGPVWRQDGTLLSFARDNDGTLALQSIDAAGAAHAPGAPLPEAAVQGSGLAARWDIEHGRALLLSGSTTTSSNAGSVTPLQAWLVSYLASTEVTR
jgi:hypothetical protein